LLDAMLAHARIVVPHLHLPLQSGSDAILRRMNRQYNTAAYVAMLDLVQAALLRDGVPPAITTDIICGFPGETEADFDATMTMARRAGFLHMHVFPYSARPGTAAARWRDLAVPGALTRQRVRRLIQLETEPGGLADQFRGHLLGQTLRVILEQPDAARPGRWLGRCDHYALVSVAQEDNHAACGRPGALVQALAHRIEDDVMLATRQPTSVSLAQHPARGVNV
jgi:tRNA A37 methylthiotransferase MiaB